MAQLLDELKLFRENSDEEFDEMFIKAKYIANKFELLLDTNNI